jgi:hypothetical protein
MGRCPAEYSTALVLPATSVTPLFPPLARPVSSATAKAAPAQTVAPKTIKRRRDFNTSDLLQGVVLPYCAASS